MPVPLTSHIGICVRGRRQCARAGVQGRRPPAAQAGVMPGPASTVGGVRQVQGGRQGGTDGTDGPAQPRTTLSPLLSSANDGWRNARRIRDASAAHPDRRRRSEPAGPARRTAPRRRLRNEHRARRHGGAAAAPDVVAGPADHRHDDAADGRPVARARDQVPSGPADHRPLGDRRRRLEGGPPRGGRRGLCHQAVPLPGAAGPDQPGPAPARRQGAAPEPGPRTQPHPRPPSPRGHGRRQAPSP